MPKACPLNGHGGLYMNCYRVLVILEKAAHCHHIAIMLKAFTQMEAEQ